MKKNLFLKVLGLAVMFTACSSEEGEMNLQVNHLANELNLQTLSYEDISSLLVDVSHSGKSIVLNNGNTTPWDITVFRDGKTTISGLDDAVFYKSRDKDSTFLTLASDYATLRLTHNGQSINYVAYKNKDRMKDVAQFYMKEFATTRSSSNTNNISFIYKESTRSTNQDIVCVALNIGEIIKAHRSGLNDLHYDYIMPEVSKGANESSRIVTRTSGEPKSVYVVCLIEQGVQLLPNEISWQMQDAATALYDISEDYIKLDFRLIKSDFVVTGDDAHAKLANFRSKLLSIEEFNDYSDQMFYLLGFGLWDSDTAGVAYVDTYSASTPLGGFWACGLSAVSSLFPSTLAHEMGHTLGALHVDDKWDLMATSNETMGRGKLHLDDKNRQKIMNNIIWE